LRGKADAVRAHCDVSGVPPEVLQKLTLVLEGWHGVSGDLRHIGTRVMTFTDYEALRRDDQKDLPEDMRNLPSRIKWNVRPEKVIVFTFASNDPKDTATKVRWSAGAYRTNGLWFFAVSYSK